jgi:hypothetical protein
MIYDDEKVMKISIFIHIDLGVSISSTTLLRVRRAQKMFYLLSKLSHRQTTVHTYRYKIDEWMHVPILIE